MISRKIMQQAAEIMEYTEAASKELNRQGIWVLICGDSVLDTKSGTFGVWICLDVGPRLKKDHERFSPNIVLLTLWKAWAGYNGGDRHSANTDASLAVINTHICAPASLLVQTSRR
ncbi:hypothetical protein AXG93_684s1280 [Marchantia polymorpha subsp. ruderalis]|uniref:Uncharacterized protein n=1 Tax=Marchantia polymorpha subsp. ruderalis TaxID=1480154 RepID=A0A176W797_MARPO|nr:hypothetical protein AXG93_684s1280 [Marchantia polymorpha subsp. ruderalis]